MDELFPLMEDANVDDDCESHIDVFDDDEELDELRFSETCSSGSSSSSEHGDEAGEQEEEVEEVFSEPNDGIVIGGNGGIPSNHSRTTPSSAIDVPISN